MDPFVCLFGDEGSSVHTAAAPLQRQPHMLYYPLVSRQSTSCAEAAGVAHSEHAKLHRHKEHGSVRPVSVRAPQPLGLREAVAE